jgi:hypothetical protein
MFEGTWHCPQKLQKALKDREAASANGPGKYLKPGQCLTSLSEASKKNV